MFTPVVYVDELRNALALLVLELILTMPAIRRRDRFGLRLVLGVVTCMAYCLLFYFVLGWMQEAEPYGAVVALSVLWYGSVVVMTALVIHICFELVLGELLWVVLTAYAAQHIAYIIACEALAGMLGNVPWSWESYGVYALVAVLVDLGVFWLFYPLVGKRERLLSICSARYTRLLLVFFLVFFATTFMNQYNAVSGTTVNYLAVLSDLINCLLVLVVQYFGHQLVQVNIENYHIRQRLETEKRQYVAFQNAVDYINIKCHDLKKELRAMGEQGSVDPSAFQELVDQIAVYESFIRTGNQTLDSLLTDKNLYCLQKNIGLSCIVDASGLEAMDRRDLYCLFENLLENAMAYVKSIPEKEDRWIRLAVRRQGGMTVIHTENCLRRELELEDGLPVTTKDDRINHGFGLKSVRRIARKYGGDLRVNAGDGLFRVDVVVMEQ